MYRLLPFGFAAMFLGLMPPNTNKNDLRRRRSRPQTPPEVALHRYNGFDDLNYRGGGKGNL